MRYFLPTQNSIIITITSIGAGEFLRALIDRTKTKTFTKIPSGSREFFLSSILKRKEVMKMGEFKEREFSFICQFIVMEGIVSPSELEGLTLEELGKLLEERKRFLPPFFFEEEEE